MKKQKRAWTRTPAQKRKDSFNWKPFGGYDFWRANNAPVKDDHGDRRSKERQNIRKVMIGFDEFDLYWPTKWERFPDYY